MCQLFVQDQDGQNNNILTIILKYHKPHIITFISNHYQQLYSPLGPAFLRNTLHHLYFLSISSKYFVLLSSTIARCLLNFTLVFFLLFFYVVKKSLIDRLIGLVVSMSDY